MKTYTAVVKIILKAPSSSDAYSAIEDIFAHKKVEVWDYVSDPSFELDRPRISTAIGVSTTQKESTMPKPVLTITNIGSYKKVEIYLLNAGEHFPRFGGSKAGLRVGETASIILRQIGQLGTIYDQECDITDKGVWEFVQRLIDRHKEPANENASS